MIQISYEFLQEPEAAHACFQTTFSACRGTICTLLKSENLYFYINRLFNVPNQNNLISYLAYKYVRIKRGILNSVIKMDPLAAEPK